MGQYFKMVQSGLISVTVIALSYLATVTLGQLDHFLPPPPARINRRRPLQQQRFAAQTPVTSGNPYLSRAYGGTWFRSNFQDLFSYRGAQKLEWFEILEGNDCSPVPATVNAGRPPRDICNEAAVDERRCICINTGRARLSDSGYEQICGNCRDPCQLKFTPDKVPRYLQRLATQNLDENGPQSEFEPDNDYDY